MKSVLAIDLGSSGVKMVLGSLKDGKIEATEIHRFPNEPIIMDGKLKWDIENIFNGIKEGIKKASKVADFETIGVDTWGVDFGLIDKDGKLIDIPYSYRDTRTRGMIEKSQEYIPLNELYGYTGNQFAEYNTLFQLLALRENEPELLEKADKLLLMPDLVNYFLTGKVYTEATICSTTQMMNQADSIWSEEVMEKYNFDKKIFPEVIAPGFNVGLLKKELADELGISQKKVIAVAAHDTASAVISVPAKEKEFAFISSGSWSILGTQTEAPVINESSFKNNLTNEAGYMNTTRFQKNITGLWLMQELKRHFEAEGKNYGFGEMADLAKESGKIECFIDPDSPLFASKGNIVSNINKYLRDTNQKELSDDGEIIKCVYNSLVLTYRFAFDQMKETLNKDFDTIYVIGGGIQDKYLCRLTADAMNKKVVAGPVDGTALGNIALQLSYDNLPSIKELIINSVETETYEPENPQIWDKAYADYIKVTKN